MEEEGEGEEGREEGSSSRERREEGAGEAREGEAWRRAALPRRRKGKGTEKACSLLVLGLLLRLLLVLVLVLMLLAVRLELLLLLDEVEEVEDMYSDEAGCCKVRGVREKAGAALGRTRKPLLEAIVARSMSTRNNGRLGARKDDDAMAACPVLVRKFKSCEYFYVIPSSVHLHCSWGVSVRVEQFALADAKYPLA